jgi:acyl-coenzyme A synthetase/AMP-(fatty) acid ligase
VQKKNNATEKLVYSISQENLDKIAIYSNEGNITYAEYKQHINEYEVLLLRLYKTSNLKLGILMDDCSEFVFLFWACLKIGIVPILINNKFCDEAIKRCIDSINLKNIITKDSKKSYHLVEQLSSERYAQYKGICFWKSEIENSVDMILDEQDIAFGIFTSGSTDGPKCVLHNHASIIKCVEYYYRAMLDITAEDIIFSTSKMMHTYGLGNTVFQAVGVNAATIICSDGTIYSVISHIEKFRPTVLFAVPSVYKEVLDLSKVRNIDMSSLRLCFSAGEHLSNQIFEDFYRKFDCKILDGMGNTEYLTTFITNTEKENRIGSCGKCIPGFTAKIVDDRGQEADTGEEGCLLIQGEIHLDSYYGDEKKYSCDDYFNTQNLCYKDKSGFIWFVGRADEMFKIKGRWVNPLEIEKVLEKIEEIEDSLAVVDKSFEINKSILYVKTKKDSIDLHNKNVFYNKIRICLKKELEHYKCPTEIRMVDEIPKGPTGKKIRKLLK